jgi:hypothetical protein
MTDERSAENRPDSDLAAGKRARRALPQLRLEWGQLLLLLSTAITVVLILLVWFF